MALPVKINGYYGIVEYWSSGVLEKAKSQKPKLKLNQYIHYSINPSLHFSLTPDT